MKTKFMIAGGLSATVMLCLAFHASATPITNKVKNGSFETGDFDQWTLGGNTSGTGVDMDSAHTGNFGAFLGPSEMEGTLSQNLDTIVGGNYELSFFLFSGGESESASLTNQLSDVEFQVFWNGVKIFDTTSPPSSYQQFQFFNLTATGTSTELKFVFRNDPSFFHLDDVVAGLSAVPETFSTLWLMLPLVGMIGFLQLRRKNA
jgi:hypothetical protein